MRTSRRAFVTRSGLMLGGAALAGACRDAAFSPPAESSADDRWRGAIETLDRRIPELMSELHVPGVSVAIVRDARIAWRKGFGVRDAESNAAVDVDTIFEAQSMSKPVFAYRVMKLCETGVLGLDTPLTRYTPDVLVPGDPRLALVTPRRVLSHTTGLPNWRSPQTPLRFAFTPGERWSYSGEGYSYLQSVVTHLVGRVDTGDCGEFELGYRVCATNFGEDMSANLLTPFGMTSSGYVWTEPIGRRLVGRHDRDGRPMTRIRATPREVARYGSAGALLSTPTDYARFIIEIIAPRPADAYRLTENSRNGMLRPQIDVPSSPIPASWALGWQVWHLPVGEVIVHGGDIDGAHAQSAFSVARRSGFVIMTNGEGGMEMISQRLLKELVDDFI